MRKQIFSKDPIVPQSNKKEPATYPRLAKLPSLSAEPTPMSAERTPPILDALVDSQLAKPTLDVPPGYLQLILFLLLLILSLQVLRSLLEVKLFSRSQ